MMIRLLGSKAQLCAGLVGLALLSGCGSSGDDSGGASDDGADGGSGGSESGSGGSGNPTSGAGGSQSDGGTGGTDSGNGNGNGNGAGGEGTSGSTTTTGGKPVLPMVPGDPDPDAPDTALPELPALVNVQAIATDDSAEITFQPIDGAVDYRVYVLPSDDDITVDDDGHLSIQDAVYRCSGDRQAAPVRVDNEEIPGVTVRTLVDNMDVFGYTRSLDEARLGYVYVKAGDGRVPVYALGDSAPDGDNDCGSRWGASRVKTYTTDESEREALLDDGWRDDGIVFYVPEDAGDDAVQISMTEDTSRRFYFPEGPEADARGGGTAAFEILGSEAEGAVPLMRVFYDKTCGRGHDELVTGMANFEQVRSQGDEHALAHLHWSGLEDDTILVVEALATGCPNRVPGIMAPESREAFTAPFNGFSIDYSAWLTPDEVKDLSDIGDLYINGQHEADSRPIPIARSFVRIGPAPEPDFDWFEGFGSDDALGDLTEQPCGADAQPGQTCAADYRLASDKVDLSFHYTEEQRYAVGVMFGELWVTYADVGADTNGKFRLTPSTWGEMTDDSYLYVTMEVDALTTGRRYPQFLISDQPAPVHHHMPDGNTLVIQTFAEWPPLVELEVCDHRYWDVNYQCPRANFHHYFNDSGEVIGLAPHPELSESLGVDRPARFEAYVSTQRAYVFLDGKAYGCVDLPDAGVPSGEVTVTFGDVLYHSGVDDLKNYDYYQETLQVVARRHFDNLGFKSGVGAPAWDEGRMPCTSELYEVVR